MLNFLLKTATFAQILQSNLMKHTPRHILVILATAAVAALSACTRERYVQISGYAQGGTYTVKCGIPSRTAADAGSIASSLKNGIDSILCEIDSTVSGYNGASLLSAWNRDGRLPECSELRAGIFYGLMHYCDSLYEATGGVLDTRSAALFDVWGFGFKSGEMPSEEQVEQARRDRSRLNFNAVAQGWSADMVGDWLHGRGIRDMLVNIGGEIYCDGVNPQGQAWKLGIDAPEDGNVTPGQKLSETFVLGKAPCGVVTSGNYRKFYVRDGVKYSHTVDPRTGAPVTHSLLSATIIAPTSALADALATYCMVVGMEEARAMIESREDLEGCLIGTEGIWVSDGFGATSCQ